MNLRLRFQVLVRDGHTCQYCGAQPPEVVLEVDHVIPRSAGGQDTLSNLVTACRECNQGKHAALLEPTKGPTDWNDWPEWESRLCDSAANAVRTGVDWLGTDWFDWTGELCTAPESYIIGQLIIAYGDTLVRQAMRVSAVRHGYTPEIADASTGDVWVEKAIGRIDLREVKRTLHRWHREQAWRLGE